ncbi:MAG: gfo/Idh/MocA family oxidoreductase, partial [Planctomycetes bacterium]|nr:gfo/Idh/MocA family oxidoreductase [Planctomycetota bacterium]
TSDDVVDAWFRTQGGVSATLAISLVEGVRRHEMRIVGERGSLIWSEKQPLRLEEEGRVRELKVSDALPSSARLKIPDTEWARCFLRLARVTTEAIRRGESGVEHAATWDDGHANQQFLDAVRADAGGSVA